MTTTPSAATEIPSTSNYETGEASWRTAREKRIGDPLGWRAVIGLHWLSPGDHVCGADENVSVPLPVREGVPKVALRLKIRANGVVDIQAEGRLKAKHDGEEFEMLSIEAPRHGVAAVRIEDFLVEIMHRGPGVGARVRDSASPQLKAPSTIRWFPPQKAWRVQARLEAKPGFSVPIMNVLGDVDKYPSPGHYAFEIDGRTYRLVPFLDSEESDTLFFIFRDKTNSKETYGAGRFLFAKRGEETVLDFNRAVSPPCAFTPFATCPVAPEGNSLDLRVAAGEYLAHDV